MGKETSQEAGAVIQARGDGVSNEGRKKVKLSDKTKIGVEDKEGIMVTPGFLRGAVVQMLFIEVGTGEEGAHKGGRRVPYAEAPYIYFHLLLVMDPSSSCHFWRGRSESMAQQIWSPSLAKLDNTNTSFGKKKIHQILDIQALCSLEDFTLSQEKLKFSPGNVFGTALSVCQCVPL